MANGYLGKISAIVSANTSDFQSKLNGAAKDVQKFASSMQSSLGAAQTKATTSLRGIYTEAQKLERALQAAASGKLSFKGFAGPDLDSAVSRMRAFASVTKEIAGPLSAAAKSFGQLSMEVQGAFNPALKQAQVLTERLADTINKTGTVSEERFHRISGAVNEAVSAMGRLSEAGKLVGGLASGKELRFQAPQFAAELTRTAALQQQAAALPPSAMAGGDVARLVAAQSQQAAEANRLYAAMENEKQLVGGDVAGATAAYREQLAVLRQVNDQLERRVTLESNIGAKTDISQTGLSSSIAAQRIKEREAEIARNIGARTDISQTGLSSSLAARRAQQREQMLAANVGARTDISQVGSASNLAAGQAAERQRRSREAIGTSPRSASELPRELESVGSRVNSLRAQIDAMPASLRQVMLPALQAIQGEFTQIAGAVSPAISQIDALENAIQHAEQNAQRLSEALRLSQSFGGAGTSGINLGLDQAVMARMQAGLNVLQSELSMVEATARGPGVDAFNNLRNAISSAMAQGTIGTERVQQELRQLATETVNTVAGLRRIDAGALGERVVSAGNRRQGDVSRMGMGNASLAVQQLGFAIDDFMSSTGGFEHKLRAVSNNISQMAFILGGTKGLFIGLAVTMTAQAGVALAKWINGGRTAEDQSKALNDALARQKSLVEELAQAYRTLGDSLTRNTFSKRAEESRDFEREKKEIVKKRREQIEDRVAFADPDVARERATQAMLDRQMGEASSPGRILLIQKQIRESKERERKAREAALSQKVTGDEAAAAIEGAGQLQFQASGFLESINPFADFERKKRRTLIPAQRRAAAAAAAQSPEELRAALVAQRDAMTGEQGYAPGANSAIDQQVAKLESMIARLDMQIATNKDNKVVDQILNDGMSVSRSLSAVQELLNEAIVPFSKTREEAEKVAKRLAEITTELENGTTPERNAELQKEMEALKQQAAAHRSAAEVVRTFADTVKRISTDLVDAVSGEAASTAEKARRESNRAQVDRGEFGPGGERRRDGDAQREAARAAARENAAQQEARRAEDEAERVRRDNERARMEFDANNADDPAVRAERRRLEQLQAVIDSDTATEKERAAAAAEKREIQRRQDRRFEDSAVGQDARNAANAADRNAARAQERFREQDERFRAAMRGRDVGITDAEKLRRETKDQMLDLVEARRESLLNEGQANRQASLFGRQQMEQAAPMIASMAEEVQNAILQGPSRAALEVKDVSSVEGQKELNRLLRGDDSAKNANIVELEKQNQKLVEVVSVLRDIARNAGIVLDL